MDEPARRSTQSAMQKLKSDLGAEEKYTIIIVTHNMQQAARVSDRTAFFYICELIELQ